MWISVIITPRHHVYLHTEFATNALRRLEKLTERLESGNATSKGVYHSVSAIDSLFVDLGRQVINHDGLGSPVASEEELVFRTARLVIGTQLDRIDQAIRAVLASQPPDSVRPEVWIRLLNAIPIGKAELRRITNIWLPHRCAESEAIETNGSAEYKMAIRKALDELRRFDEIPEIETMLYRGIASTKWPEIANACEQILVAIHVRIDLRAARRLWAALSQWERALGVR